MDTKELKKAIRLAKAKWTVSKELTRGAETNYAMGLIPEKKKQKAKGLESVKAVRGGLPSKVDLTPFCTPIRNQLQYGACVAFSTVKALEMSMNIKLGQRIPDLCLSVMQPYACGGGGKGGTGWSISSAMRYLKKWGACSEAVLPYKAQDAVCDVPPLAKDWKNRIFKPNDTHAVNDSDWSAWLAAGFPIVFAMGVYEDFQRYRSGIYSHVAGNLQGFHAVLAIGYDKDSWLVANSWGSGFGMNGFFRIAKNDVSIQKNSGWVHRI